MFSGNIISAVDSGEIRIWDNQGNPLSQAMNAGPQLRIMTKKPGEEVIATGGVENALKIWDLGSETSTFEAKNVRPDYLELRVPVHVTNARFLNDKGLITTTTGTHHVILQFFVYHVRLDPSL